MHGDSPRAGVLSAPARAVFAAARLAGETAVELLFPPVCMSCGERRAEGFCDACLLEIFAVPAPTCGLCGRFLRSPGLPCRDCRQTAFAFSRARGAARYAGLLRALLRRFKLGNEMHLARPLGQLAADLAERECPRPGAVVPVPISRRKLLARGFNQAELLAESVAARLGRPMFPKALVRLRRAGKQAFLTRAGRIANAEGLFAPRKPLLGRPPDFTGKLVLLVDDVITTGATASACAAALRAMGAADVVAIAVGR
ncbi:MAG: ComF family protein [Planctomycetia bacterium]|nr:ComF family protein [Planctomycetia bacterium]